MTSDCHDLALVRKQIARNYGFMPPDIFVADLIAYTDGKSVPGWSGGHSAAFWNTLGVRYGFTPPPKYVEALKRFVDDLERMREDEGA